MGDEVYKCSQCGYQSSRRGAIQYYMFKHAPKEGVPYLCVLCNLRGLTEGKWFQHCRAVARKPHREDSPQNNCIISKNPCKVQIGVDIVLVLKTETRTTEPETRTTEPEVRITEPEVKTTEPEVRTT